MRYFSQAIVYLLTTIALLMGVVGVVWAIDGEVLHSVLSLGMATVLMIASTLVD